MKTSNILILIFIISPLFLSFASCSEVPAILWNIQGESLQVQPVPAFTPTMQGPNGYMMDDGAVKDGFSGMIVFLVDKLSMEDLALQPYYEDPNSTIKLLRAFLEDHPFMMYPNVKDPAKGVRKLKCGVEDIYVTTNMEGRILRAINSALEQSCVVVVHLPHTSSLVENKLLFDSDLFHPALQTDKKNIIGMFTAKKSSWESTDGNSRKARNLLQVDEVDPHFMNVSGCVMLYAENVTLVIGGNNGTYDLPLPPSATADCDSNNTALTLTFSETDKISKVILKFEFERKASSWGASNATVQIFGEGISSNEVVLPNSIEGPNSFSYSCGSLVLKGTDSNLKVALVFDTFQIQAYDIGDKFADSVNCVTWFTLPIWMGTFILVLFLTILNCGVYYLFQAKTMDRFDDPKGKTITVPQTD